MSDFPINISILNKLFCANFQIPKMHQKENKRTQLINKERHINVISNFWGLKIQKINFQKFVPKSPAANWRRRRRPSPMPRPPIGPSSTWRRPHLPRPSAGLNSSEGNDFISLVLGGSTGSIPAEILNSPQLNATIRCRSISVRSRSIFKAKTYTRGSLVF